MQKEQTSAGRKTGKGAKGTRRAAPRKPRKQQGRGRSSDTATKNKPSTATASDALTKKIAEIKQLLIEADKQDVAARYKIAVEFKAVIAGDGNVYGAGAARKLGQALGWGKTAVYAYDAVAKTWSADQFSELAGKRDKFDKPLSWSHLMLLAVEKDGAQRRKLIKQTIDNGWSVRELKRAFAGIPSGDASAGTAAPSSPHTLINAVANYESSMKAAQANAATYGNAVVKQIKDAEHSDPGLLARLKKARADLESHYKAESQRLDELIREVEAREPVDESAADAAVHVQRPKTQHK